MTEKFRKGRLAYYAKDWEATDDATLVKILGIHKDLPNPDFYTVMVLNPPGEEREIQTIAGKLRTLDEYLELLAKEEEVEKNEYQENYRHSGSHV